MYVRIYPSKTNTIFINNTGYTAGQTGLINTGKNPLMQLRDGGSQSKLLFNFDITNYITKLTNNTFTANLCLFDAGQITTPAISLKEIDLFYFTQDFKEGSGYSYDNPTYVEDVSNWLYYDQSNAWNNILTTNIIKGVYSLESANEDLMLSVTSFVNTAVTGSINNFNLGISITESVASTCNLTITGGSNGTITSISLNSVNILSTPVSWQVSNAYTANLLINAINSSTIVTAAIDPNNSENIIISGLLYEPQNYNGYTLTITSNGAITYTTTAFTGGILGFEPGTSIEAKYIFSKYTSTIFKPYLELVIQDEVIEDRTNIFFNQPSNLYLVSKNNYSNPVTCNVIKKDGTVIQTLTVTNPDNGVYKAIFTPTTTDLILYDVWYTNSKTIAQNLLNIQDPDSVIQDLSTNIPNLFFYASQRMSKVTLGDKVRVELNAEIRYKNKLGLQGFEYRVLNTSGFEMIPWTPSNLYQGQMYFYIDTSFFFPDLEYEIYTRFNNNEIILTSDIVNKFKVIDSDRNRLDSFAASPYNSRDYFLRKHN